MTTGARCSDAGYRWSAAGDECTDSDPDGKLRVRLLYDADTGGHVVERYHDGTVAARARYDGHGRARP